MDGQEFSLMRYIYMPIHPEGWRFVGMFAVGTAVLFFLWTPLGWLGLLLTVWCLFFFRDPDRVTPVRAGLVISPADGVVQSITQTPPPIELGMGDAPLPRVSVFMSVFNVHVNRVPLAGRILRRAYNPGRFFNASLEKASAHNERMAIRMTDGRGREVAFVQIAGLVARRIRCDLVEGQEVLAGERFGLIRFGSRLDIYLPAGVSPLVAAGQTALAGETVLADLDGIEGPRLGEKR